MSDNPYKNISDEELDDLIFQGAGGFVGQKRKELLSERQQRRDKKYSDNRDIQEQIKKDQKCVKILTMAILICTIALLFFAIFQFFK